MLIIFIIILIILLILYKIWDCPIESYQNLNIYPSRLFFMRKFAKLHNGKIVSLDIKPIEPTINESKCDISPCPLYFADNMTCYNCY
jgi:hypothetical protein